MNFFLFLQFLIYLKEKKKSPSFQGEVRKVDEKVKMWKFWNHLINMLFCMRTSINFLLMRAFLCQKDLFFNNYTNRVDGCCWMLAEGGLATDPVCVRGNADNLPKHPSFGVAASMICCFACRLQVVWFLIFLLNIIASEKLIAISY